MTELSDIIAALANGIARARAQADVQTVELARLYQADPLLKTLSVPRIRLPEVSLDVPLLLESYVAAVGDRSRGIDELVDLYHRDFEASIQRAGVRATSSVPKAFVEALRQQLTSLANQGALDDDHLPKAVFGAYEVAATRAKLTPDQDALLRQDLQASLTRWPIRVPGSPARTLVTATSEDIKERGTPASTITLKLTLREEGLEWTTVPGPDGTSIPRLVAE